jgi:hypothetical protein
MSGDTHDHPHDLDGLMADASALDAAVAQAQDALGAAQAEAGQQQGDCKLYEVSGIGRYAIANAPGWRPVLDLVRDPSVDINFSLTNYPAFDAVLSDHARSDHLDFPDDEQYDTRLWRNLRDNIAAVRNALMQLYYANTPEGVSTGDAEKSLREIAAYVGDALTNNMKFAGIVKNHDPSQPFIDLDRAAAPDGAGAQYLWEEILKRQRRSGWNFLSHYGNWHLPASPPHLICNGEGNDVAMLEADLANLEGEREALQNRFDAQAATTIEDLDFIGEHMLDTNAQALQSVGGMDASQRERAVQLARDILDKLKLKFGDKQALDGLNIRPEDGVSILGSLTSVGDTYRALLAWARTLDPAIVQDRSVMAATQAFGQLAFMAKTEAHRLALGARNHAMADRLGAQLSALAHFRPKPGTSFGDLMTRVRAGIDAVMQVKSISGPGAQVGHSRDKDIGGGTYMSAAPIAGLAAQTTTDGSNRNAVGKISEDMVRAQDAAAQAQANRIQSQLAANRAQQATGTAQSASQGNSATTPSRSGSGRGQQALRQARVQQQLRSSSSVTALAQANLTAAQRNAALMQRNAAMRSLATHHDEHHDEHHPSNLNRMQQLVNADMQRAIKAATNTQGLAGAPVVVGRSGLQAMAAGQQKVMKNMYGKASKVEAPGSDEEKRRKDLLPPPPPPNKGRSI